MSEKSAVGSSVQMWNWTNCILCRHSKIKVFLEQSPYRLVQCSQCGLIFMNPRPRDVGEHNLDTKERLEVLIQEHKRVRDLWCQENLSWVQRYVKRGRLLDIGSSAGFFLAIARKAGWDVAGIEPSGVMVEYGRKFLGLPIICGKLNNQTVDLFNAESFDAVTMWEVMEHLPDPLKGLELVWSLLKPGGVLFIQVPNIESSVFRLFGKRWHNLSIHCHTTFFSQDTLKALIKRCNYNIESIFTHSHIYRQIGQMSFRGIPLDSNSRMVRAVTMLFNHWLLKITGSGDHIVVVARKIRRNVTGKVK